VPGCALGPRDGGLLELGTLGLALQGGLLSIPDTPGGVALPVVFVFHGAGSTGAAARTYGLEAAADGGANLRLPGRGARNLDVGGLSADARRVELALRRLSETRCIDPDRVFISGFSAGAVFTLYLGCNVPTAFRAMAVIAGSDRRFDTSCCRGAISALFIHGTADDTIPLLDGQLARNRTLSRDGCSLTSEPGAPSCETRDCPPPWTVEFCTWPGGHAVPDWAGAEMWRFFGSLPPLD
jgi:poly(3-hydroxybutyrate) depolymerase